MTILAHLVSLLTGADLLWECVGWGGVWNSGAPLPQKEDQKGEVTPPMVAAGWVGARILVLSLWQDPVMGRLSAAVLQGWAAALAILSSPHFFFSSASLHPIDRNSPSAMAKVPTFHLEVLGSRLLWPLTPATGSHRLYEAEALAQGGTGFLLLAWVKVLGLAWGHCQLSGVRH